MPTAPNDMAYLSFDDICKAHDADKREINIADLRMAILEYYHLSDFRYRAIRSHINLPQKVKRATVLEALRIITCVPKSWDMRWSIYLIDESIGKSLSSNGPTSVLSILIGLLTVIEQKRQDRKAIDVNAEEQGKMRLDAARYPRAARILQKLKSEYEELERINPTMSTFRSWFSAAGLPYSKTMPPLSEQQLDRVAGIIIKRIKWNSGRTVPDGIPADPNFY